MRSSDDSTAKAARSPHHLATQALHADEALSADTAVAAPIYQTSTFRAPNADEFREMAERPRHARFYTRYGNPTNARAEAVIAALEGAESAMLTASGMAAMSTAVLALVRAGDHVVLQENHYAGTTALARDVLSRFGVDSTTVDQRAAEHFERALRPNTRLIVVESPSNPLLRLTDLAVVASLARSRGIQTIADNTFATPFNQRPLALGIDLVIHSATKYLGGHSDLTAGAIAGPRELLEQIWRTAIVLGSGLGPFDAWLLLRGLRTLTVRMEAHNRAGRRVAAMLAGHPAVRTVHYPGLASHPQHELAARQMRGFGGIMSLELHGGFVAAERFVSSLTLASRAASVGGVESLVVHPAAMLSGTMSAEEFAAVGVSPDLVRLSVGLEDPDDLIADITQALSP